MEDKEIEKTLVTQGESLENPNDEELTTWGMIKDVLKFTALSLLIVIPIRTFIAQPFLVSGSSMVPTFHDGEYLIIDELSYDFSSPARGQVIVFRYPNDPSKYFIKRIIGLPSETVVVENGTVTIKNPNNPNGLELKEPYINEINWGYRNITMKLSPDEYFVMGDNRNASSDSREWGALPKKFITGHVAVRLLPINKAEAAPGSTTYK